jgi:hypothetical protein
LSISAVVIRGDLSHAEFEVIVACIRGIDTVEGRTLEVVAVDPTASGIEIARGILADAIPTVPGRNTSALEFTAADQLLGTEERMKFTAGNCPDCGQHDSMIPGPRGGMSQNYACDRCGTEFNVTIIGGKAMMLSRNSLFGEPNVDRLRSVFGIML